MNEDFAPFELAKKLKEKGYPQHICECAYIMEDDEEEENYVVGDIEHIEFIPDYLQTMAAPTISQVLKWLRNEKKIFVVVFIDDDSDCPVTYNIFNGTNCVYHHHGKYFALSEWSKCEMEGMKTVIDKFI